MNTNNRIIKARFLIGCTGVLCALAAGAGPTAAASLVTALGSNAPAAQLAPAVAASLRVETPIEAADKPGVFAKAHTIRAAFGMPDGSRSEGVHVRDQGRHAEYDEVTEEDAAGKPVALTQVDQSGQVLMAVRFDLPGKADRAAGRDAARARATQGAVAAGLGQQGDPEVVPTDAQGGWDVRWQRSRDGIAVRGDEVRVHVRVDGSIGSVGQVTHDLAARPASTLSLAQARALVADQTRAWSARSGSDFSVDAAELQWVGPNAAFDPSKIGAADEPYRLAWVVNVTPKGEAAAYTRQVVLFVDAGTGALLGGDVVE